MAKSAVKTSLVPKMLSDKTRIINGLLIAVIILGAITTVASAVYSIYTSVEMMRQVADYGYNAGLVQIFVLPFMSIPLPLMLTVGAIAALMIFRSKNSSRK